MSDENQNSKYPCNYSDHHHHHTTNDMGSEGFPFSFINHDHDQNLDPFILYNHHQNPNNGYGFDPSHLILTNSLHEVVGYNSPSTADHFDLSPGKPVYDDALINNIDSNNPSDKMTANSSLSFSSSEAGLLEQDSSKVDLQIKVCEDGHDDLKSNGVL